MCTGTPRSEVLEEVECAPSPHLALILKVAGLGTTREVELPLTNYKSTIFYYVQKLLQLSCNGSVKSDKLRRIWEPTYTWVTHLNVCFTFKYACVAGCYCVHPLLTFTLAVCLSYRIMYRELKDSDKEKESGKMVICFYLLPSSPSLSITQIFLFHLFSQLIQICLWLFLWLLVVSVITNLVAKKGRNGYHSR